MFDNNNPYFTWYYVLLCVDESSTQIIQHRKTFVLDVCEIRENVM